MIFQLIKRDPAWRMAPIVALVVGVVAMLYPSDPRRVNSLTLMFTVVMGCSVQARPHVRATLFEAALPIAGRDLWVARVLSLLALVWLPVLCGVCSALLVRFDGTRAVALVEAAAILTAATLALQAVRVRQLAGPRWFYVGWAVLWPVGFLACYFVAPGVVIGACGLASAAMLIGSWRAVPASFQVAPLEAADSVAVPENVPDVPVARMAFAWMPVLRSASWLPAIFFPCMVAGALFGSWFAFFPIFTVQGAVQTRQRTRWLSALPLSYRRLLLITLVSSVLPIVAGVAVGICIGALYQDNSMTAGPMRQALPAVNVALEFWRYAPGDKVPVIQAPWGETVDAGTFRALGLTFYNPYSVGWRSSRQLREWQWGRATEAVYGRQIPLAQFGAAHNAGLKPLTDRPLMRILTLEAAVLLGLLLVFATELPRGRLLSRLPANVRVYLVMGIFGLPFAAVYGVEIYYSTHHFVPIVQALFDSLLLRLASALPNPWLAVGAAAVPVLAMYGLLERQFRQSEVTQPSRARQ
jgi:hypothetical protein